MACEGQSVVALLLLFVTLLHAATVAAWSRAGIKKYCEGIKKGSKFNSRIFV